MAWLNEQVGDKYAQRQTPAQERRNMFIQEKVGAKTIPLMELIKENPKGKKIRIIG